MNMAGLQSILGLVGKNGPLERNKPKLTWVWSVSLCPLQAWESDEAIEEDMPESPGAEKQDKEKDHRDSKKNRGETNRGTTHVLYVF